MPELTIVSFNAHAGLRPHRRGPCRPYDLVEALRSFDADVVVLQESFTPDEEPAAVQKVAAELGSQLHELTLGRARLEPWPHLLSAHGGRGTTGVAVMSRFPSERRGVLPLPKVWGDPARRRGALHVEIDVDGHPVDLVAVHLTSRLPHGPVIQMRHLWPQLPPPTRTAIVAGDHNFWGPGVVASLPRWRRAVRGRTWPAPRPHSQIDHILVRDGTRVVSSEVLPDVGSDHRPVRAHLQIS